MNELSLDGFRHHIRQTYGSESQFFGRERVHEQFDGQPAWEGEVLVFQLLNHPTATHCYAWEQDGRVTAVLHGGHITSAVDAVRASLLGELDDPPKHE